MAKYRELGRHFAGQLADLLGTWPAGNRHRARILASRGGCELQVDIGQIAFCVSEDKLTFAVTKRKERLLLNESMTELAAKLDPEAFFRVNRNFLVQADTVQSFASSGKGRLTLRLVPAASQLVQVSQGRTRAFRAWIARLAAHWWGRRGRVRNHFDENHGY